MAEHEHDELRRSILAGEEVRIVLTTRLWHRDGQISHKPVGELYRYTTGGSWKRKPDLVLMANPANGPEDIASIVKGYADWLAAGRTPEAPQ